MLRERVDLIPPFEVRKARRGRRLRQEPRRRSQAFENRKGIPSAHGDLAEVTISTSRGSSSARFHRAPSEMFDWLSKGSLPWAATSSGCVHPGGESGLPLDAIARSTEGL